MLLCALHLELRSQVYSRQGQGNFS
jgi:hypothetical protein